MINYWQPGYEWMGHGLQGHWCPSFAHYQLQSPDVSGLGNHAQLGNFANNGNNAIVTSGGKGALDLDGQINDVRIDGNSAFSLQNLSVSMWVYMRSQNTQIKAILDNEHSASQGWVIQSEDAVTNQRFYFAWYTGFGYQGNGPSNSITIPLEKRSHVCYAKNGRVISGYLDGRLIYSNTMADGNIAYSSPPRRVFIGGAILAGRQWNGQLDDIRIYNRGFAASEALATYEAGRGGGMGYQPPLRRSYLVPSIPIPRRRSSRALAFPG